MKSKEAQSLPSFCCLVSVNLSLPPGVKDLRKPVNRTIICVFSFILVIQMKAFELSALLCGTTAFLCSTRCFNIPGRRLRLKNGLQRVIGQMKVINQGC